MAVKSMTGEAVNAQRGQLHQAQSIVIKVGSQQLVKGENFERLAQQIAQLMQAEKRVVLVSSGAIALGLSGLKTKTRPTDLPSLQAAAAIGQMRLMQRWSRAFSSVGTEVAQILLTHSDLVHRRRYLNAKAAMKRLLDAGVIPIVNENDTVSVEEIKLGDNDALAAEICGMVDAELLILLTNTDGLYDRDPTKHEDARRVAFVPDGQSFAVEVGEKSALGTGGMGTKLEAVRIARVHKAACVIARPDADVLRKITGGHDVGTLFANDENVQQSEKESARKRWIALTLRPKGTLFIDEGAHLALLRGASILSVGATKVAGTFEREDCIDVVFKDALIARGLSTVNSKAMKQMLGLSSPKIDNTQTSSLNDSGKSDELEGGILIHRDNLVLV